MPVEMTRTLQRMLSAAAAGAMLCLAPMAAAQNALGDGRALDANLSTRGRYNQPKQGFLLNRINEAIVTGTAPGGKSFRGDVGYTSPFAFRGSTAGGRLYDFERDSFYSNIAPRRGAPHQPGMLGSYQIPDLRQRGDSPYAAGATVLTPMSGASLQQIARARYGTGLPDFEASASVQQFRPNRSAATESLDATTGSAVERQLSPLTLAAINSVDPLLNRTSLLAASASGALRPSTPWPAPDNERTATTPGVTRNALARGIDRTFDGVAFAEGWTNRIAAQSAASPSAAEPLLAGQDAYADYVARLTAPRGQLPEPGQAYSAENISGMRDFSRDVLGISAPGGVEAPIQPPASPLESLDETRLNQLTQPLPPIKTLAGDNTSQFAERVRLGETALSEGRFFDAESWFDIALYYTPQHPLALAGRAHAQLGSGKYRSAALGLRRLFEAHPELINSRYESNLLPPPERLDAIAAELEQMIARPGAAIESGLLLAYVGHLTDRPELIEKGLTDLAARQEDDALGPVLRRIWLAEPKP